MDVKGFIALSACIRFKEGGPNSLDLDSSACFLLYVFYELALEESETRSICYETQLHTPEDLQPLHECENSEWTLNQQVVFLPAIFATFHVR